AAGDRDELTYTRYRLVQLATAQGRPKAEQEERRAALVAVDPRAAELLSLADVFVDELLPLAERYEKEGRRHSAIRVHKELLAIEPERQASLDAIDRLAAAPDPSLAEDAKPKDLLAGVDAEWIAEHDAEHSEWKERAKLERDNYVTHTNAGYEVLVRAGEAMEQMNAFYRQFFRYGTEEHGGSVSRIDLWIFKNRAEYLELGSGPPVEWSGGQFTGSTVETYIGDGGFEEATGTLFHEAAHQFVGLATNAAGWLNEGLASFFEGCRILANGTVLMNLPANHRLFPLAERMEQGWMASHDDGVDPANPDATPRTAPTFRIVLENRYQWGPPWYAPTWGVVYFLYNYQDRVDGRYVYRAAFQEFVDKSGGRVGEGAVENFVDVVLGNPSAPTPGVEYPDGGEPELPRTVEELDAVWKAWILALRDEQAGRSDVERPWLAWARHAIAREDLDVAAEHFEKGLLASPDDPDLLEEFARFLHEVREASDRATKLQLLALRALEQAEPADAKRIAAAEKQLAKYDPRRKELDAVHRELHAAAGAIVQRYLADEQYLLTMQLARELGGQLDVPGMDEVYTTALERGGRSLDIWQLAYNERDLDGWVAAGREIWSADGERLRVHFGEYAPDQYDFQSLSLDEVTSGDYSFEAEVAIRSGEGAFAGLVFGRKGDQSYHAFILFPPRPGAGDGAPAGYVDLTTFYSGSDFEIWRHTAVDSTRERERSSTGTVEDWHTLRVDVVGAAVDVWFDGVYVATQTFASRDVVRGAFGLITGPGEAQFRNVRYLNRDPRDRAAHVEREQRLAALAATGGGLGGSYLGFVPPFPEVQRWIREPLAAWDDLGIAPTVFVLWSIQQNDLMPLHEWLADLAAQYEPLGVRFVSVCGPDDLTVEEYLATHPFPGSVGLDAREGFGIGHTFEHYSIDLFNLPRVLLLDLDHTVAWEGDPGFAIGQPWSPGVESFLDAPLAKLVEDRRLADLRPWRA
ncbi:MAG TPA: family 16 glycoside hydrolase, partial [Planctomycetota bacterium]|nr:family 16 glycoside hydrolase [Planctomycetota bacterium]